MAWNKREETGSDLLIKLKGGDSVEGVLLGDPIEYYAYFKDEGGKKKMVVGVDGDGVSKYRFRVNFAVNTPAGWVAKILEGATQINNAIADVAGAGYDLSETVLKLSREGSGQFDTKYRIVPTPKKLSPQDKATIGLLDLNDLSK